MNNDILIPGAVYWRSGDQEAQRFSVGRRRIPWTKKWNEVLWRGSASGGRNTDHNWRRFQRHRLISMLNGTQVHMTLEDQLERDTPEEQRPQSTSANASLPYNFPLPNQKLYPLESHRRSVLPDFIRKISNAAFTWLVCFPGTKTYSCPYTGPWYRRGTELRLERMFQAKYLPDVEGNSFSGRYLAFLKSDSLPIKATIYSEWHDDRLVPWKHFVPMDNTFMDLWAILEYFIARDEKAEKIALEGQKWAEKVLRKEDMLAYVYRLILEYKRVSSDQREEMGWVEDSSQ